MTAGRRAEADRVEADYPGWMVTLSCLGRWYAAPAEPIRSASGEREYRPNLGADGPDGLRAVLDAWSAAADDDGRITQSAAQ